MDASGWRFRLLLGFVLIAHECAAIGTSDFVLSVRVNSPSNHIFLPIGNDGGAPAISVTIDWGDSVVQDATSVFFNTSFGSYGIFHQYSVAGDYAIALARLGAGPVWVSHFGWPTSTAGWAMPNNGQVKQISSFGDLGITSLQGALLGIATDVLVPADIPGTVTNLAYMFHAATAFNQPIGSWIVSQIRSMEYMFSGAILFNRPIGSWDVSSVTSMSHMFYDAKVFNQPIGAWNVSKVSSMSNMFALATAFNEPIGSWNVSGVTSMDSMFYGAIAFNQPLESWDVRNVANMESMFNLASAFNQPIGSWDVSQVTLMNYMFYRAAAFNQAVDQWDVSRVTGMNLMFANAAAFNQAIGFWDVSQVTGMDSIFSKAPAFNQPIGSWDVSRVVSMNSMFSYAVSFNQPIGSWNVGSVTSMSYMFYMATAFNQPIGSWDVSALTNVDVMFYNASSFNQSLASWCFAKIASEPPGFVPPLLPEPYKPVWGTCPGGTPIAPPNDIAVLNDGGNAGVIGGAIGGVLAVLLVAAIVAAVLLLRRRKRLMHDSAKDATLLSPLSDEPQQRGTEAATDDRGDGTNVLAGLLSQSTSNLAQITNLTVMQELGRGSFGRVLLAMYNGEFVAVKSLPASESQANIKTFLEEANLMASMKENKNVVKFLGVYVNQDGEVGLVMEFCPRGSLQSYIKHNATSNHVGLSPYEVFKFSYGIISGMIGLVGSGGIVHRDLAARNILLDERLFAKVSDFGLSKRTSSSTNNAVGSESTLATDSLGPVKWHAPEVIRSRLYSEKSDVWAFGATVIEMFTGKEPYFGFTGTLVELVIQIRDHSCTPLSFLESFKSPVLTQIPDYFVSILRSCFAQQAEDRPTFREIRYQLGKAAREFLNRYDNELDEAESILLSSGQYGSVTTTAMMTNKTSRGGWQAKSPTSSNEVAGKHQSGFSKRSDSTTSTSIVAQVADEFAPTIDLSRVERLGKLGEGAFGAVYLGITQGQYVALKVLAVSGAVPEDIHREAAVMTSIPPHRNIVQLYGVLSLQSEISIVMEFAPRGSLESAVQTMRNSGAPISEALLFKWAVGIARGMQALAAVHVIHRDLASRNILLDSSLEPKISDFGLSRTVLDPNQESSTKTDIGPIRWFAPECFSFKYSEKTDVWAYGCTLIEIITGRVPLHRLQLLDVVSAVRDRRLSPLDSLLSEPEGIALPDWLRKSMEKCFAYKPQNRSNFAEIVSFLEQAGPSIKEIREAEEQIQKRRERRGSRL